MKTRYLIGFVRGRNTKFLSLRETNYRRACKTLRELLVGNERYKKGVVCSAEVNSDGHEDNLKILYKKGK